MTPAPAAAAVDFPGLLQLRGYLSAAARIILLRSS